jgi:hypothetical protein
VWHFNLYFLLFCLSAAFFQSLNLCTSFILYVLSSDTLTSGITHSTVRLMIELVQKSLSKDNDDDEEYKKMKQRILTIVNQSSQDDIFYVQRFNVRIIFIKKNNSFIFLRHMILFLKHLLIYLVII